MAKPAEIAPNEALQGFLLRWRQQQLLRMALLALIPAVALLFLLLLWLSFSKALFSSTLVFIALFFLLHRKQHYKKLTLASAVAWLDQHHQQLQHSTSLLLQEPGQLSLPARLQRQRIADKAAKVAENQKPPVNLTMPLAILALVFLGGMLLVKVGQPHLQAVNPFNAGVTLNKADSATQAQIAAVKGALPELQEARIRLAPPAYTGQAAQFHELADLQVPEGSRLTWQLKFSDGVEQVFLTDQQNNKQTFSKTSKGAWTTQLVAQKPLFYRIGYASATDTAWSPFLKVGVQPDRAPGVQILEPEQYLLEQDGKAFGVAVEAEDDYSLEDVYLSLTISRGSGEQVNFRDEKIWIETAGAAKKVEKQIQLDPRTLGMQPGDELYYRLEAHDNKPPRGQHRRSNTWFYQWKDTAAATSMMSSGLALKAEPEYFRSQRQIIIDTEKLISTQKSAARESWEKKSQDLAIDQKMLRLRYGKFLGEEFVSSAGGAQHAHEEEEAPHDDETEYDNERHEHDLAGHEEPAGAAPAAGLLEMYGHAHDTEEGATFYEERVKVKLKAALAEMWEAEKYLRLYQPAQALPYEYRALKIIKDVQQSTRIYVERVGLELPSLVPQEHRLKGEQAAIQPQNRSQQSSAADTLAATKQLLARLSFWEEGAALTQREQQLARQSSKEVARLLVQGGPYMRYFYLLNSLNSLQQPSVPPAAEVRRVEKGLLQLLPPQTVPSPQQQRLSEPQKQFLKITGLHRHE